MADSFGTEEFAIDTSKVKDVELHTKKIERLFGVKVGLDVSNGNNQWLVVSGNQENRRRATSYVHAMCNPEKVISLRVRGRPALDDAGLEKAERASGSFIQHTGSLTLQVMGSEFACTLAVSQLEQTYQVTVTDVKTVEEAIQPEALLEDCPQPRNVSPTEVLTGVENIVMDVSDPPSLEDSELFSHGKGVPSQTDPRHVQTSPTHSQAGPNTAPTHTARSRKKAGRTFQATVSDSSGRVKNPSPLPSTSSTTVQTGRENTGEASSEMGREWEDGVSREAQVEEALDVQKQKSELQSVGLGMGYTEEEIEDTWPFFDFSQQKVQPQEFLTALDAVRAKRVKEDGKGNDGKRAAGPEKRSSGASVSSKGPTTGKGKQKARKDKQGKNVDITVTKSNAGKSSQNTPSKTTAVSPEKTPSSADSSVLVFEDEGNDSVIFMGKDDDDSVCLVDSSFSAFSGKRHFPGSPQSGFPEAVKKRTDYLDDEDQTMVLKPYSASPKWKPGGKQDKREEWAQAAEASISAHPSAAAAATSSEVATAKGNSNLRFIVIDGSNVAMTHGNDEVFSCRGIKICVDYFVHRGHRVKAWVPLTKTYQKQGPNPPVINQEILEELKKQGYLGYTPARTLNHKHFVSHDDPFILELAKKEDAVIVSNDNFREFVQEFRSIIEDRVLSYVFSDDHFMLPRDPRGRHGPTLDQFLSRSPPVPQRQAAVKGTAVTQGPYGGSTSSQNAPLHRNVPPNRNSFPAARQPHTGTTAQKKDRDQPRLYSEVSGTLRAAVVVPPAVQRPSSPPVRHKKVTQQLLEALKMVFPGKEQEGKIRQVLDNHNAETDLNKLTNYCIAALNL